MSQDRTAQYLCDATRLRVGIYDRTKLRDGFATDEGEAERSILLALNAVCTEILQTGMIRCRFYLRATAGTREYRFDRGIGEVQYVLYKGALLEKTRLTTLHANRRGWLTAGNGTPREWYNDIPDVLGLNPAPTTTDASTATGSIEVLADALSDDMANPTDVLQRLPSQFHDNLPDGAAALLIPSFGGAEADIARAMMYRQKWEKALERMQAFAMNREQGESAQIRPDSYREPWSGGV